MLQYTFKTYIFGGVEHYVYGEAYADDTVISSQAVTFPDSLLSLAYMDIDTVEPIIQKLNDALWQLTLTQEQQYQQIACTLLDELAPYHIYFQQFRLDWKYRISRAMIFGQFTEDILPRKYLYELPETLRRMQTQIMELFKNVLDIDSGTETVSQRMAAYYKTAGDHAFHFHPQPVGFELINDEVFTEVLEPNSIYDLIDYHLRECVKREVKMRVCKNCGRYFSITGRANTGYCNRPFDSRGRTCKEVGAIAQWTLSKKDDDVFKDYRREYKKRFARMKAGTLPSQEFYAWSKKAREKKAACEAGEITVDKFKAWTEMT